MSAERNGRTAVDIAALPSLIADAQRNVDTIQAIIDPNFAVNHPSARRAVRAVRSCADTLALSLDALRVALRTEAP